MKLKPPKTKAGIRTVGIDQKTCKRLRAWKSMQSRILADFGILASGETVGDDRPVVCNAIGEYADATRFASWWAKWRERHGFHGLKFHELRHTQATHLLASGVDVKTVQTRMGHSKAALTLDWYAHAVPEKDREAANLIGRLFSLSGLQVIDGKKSRQSA